MMSAARYWICHVVAHDGMAIMAEDVNARIASAIGTCQDDFNDILDESLEPHQDHNACLPSRQSAGQYLCAFGRS